MIDERFVLVGAAFVIYEARKLIKGASKGKVKC